MQFESLSFRLLARVRPTHRPKSAPRVRRSMVVLASLTAALGLALAVSATASATSAHAATWLRYQRGYSVQGSWLCYGWSSGAYRCTQHWYSANGQLVSLNTGWVPNYDTGSTDSTDTTAAHSAPVYTAPVVRNDPPAPASSTGSGGSVQSLIQSVFGAYAGQALRVAACESGYDPSAINRSSGASGVFQFLHSTWVTTSYAGYSPFNAWANVNAAHQVFTRDGYSWREWTCQP